MKHKRKVVEECSDNIYETEVEIVFSYLLWRIYVCECEVAWLISVDLMVCTGLFLTSVVVEWQQLLRRCSYHSVRSLTSHTMQLNTAAALWPSSAIWASHTSGEVCVLMTCRQRHTVISYAVVFRITRTHYLLSDSWYFSLKLLMLFLL